MRKSRVQATAVLVVAVISFAGRVSAQHGFFVDERLESEIRRQISTTESGDAPLTEDDLRRVVALTARNKQIQDLRGIERCENLMRLDLAGNQITDLSPLETLTRLESVDLSGNSISALDPVRRLSRLKYLNLSRNRVLDIGPLSSLPRLQALDLSDNQISDIRPLSKLRDLWSLDLSSNRITNVGPLSQLANLLSLELDQNHIQDVSVLRQLTGLRTVSLEDNEIQDIGPLIENAQSRESGSLARRFWRISLRGNPLTEHSVMRLPTLRKYVWNVDFEESSSIENEPTTVPLTESD